MSRIAIEPNAAMTTKINEASIKATAGYIMRMYGYPHPKVPTKLMLHYEGHGPRRVYLQSRIGKHYVVIKRRKVWLTEKQLKKAQEMAA